MIKSWIFYLLALAGCVVFHAYYFGWYSWFVLQLMVILPLLSLLLSLPAMLRARLDLQVQRECLRHEAICAVLQTGGGIFPMPRCRYRLMVEHCMTGEKEFSWKRADGKDHWCIRLNTAHVGLLRCSAEKARVYDYLGLFCIPMRTGDEVCLLVKPQAQKPNALPNLTRFLTKQLRPKPGGGFSEEHEMRTYRPGDPLRSVHWKLSAKTDDLIIREAQEPVRGKVLLTLDLVGAAEQIDDITAHLLWLSQWLLEHEAPHSLLWIDPQTCQLQTEEINDENQLQTALEKLLCVRLQPDTPSLAQRRFAGADWRYHILSEREVKA